MSAALRYLKALSDETRLRLALVLQRYELSVNELVTLLAMGQSRVSRHLKILAEAGLIHARRDGLWVFYSAMEGGPGRRFLDSVLPFALEDSSGRADLDMAARIIEERTSRTRQFFNSIAEDWDELNREVLGEFRLPEAVVDILEHHRAETSRLCETCVDLGCGTGEVVELLRHNCREVIGVDGSPRMLELARSPFRQRIPPGFPCVSVNWIIFPCVTVKRTLPALILFSTIFPVRRTPCARSPVWCVRTGCC